MSVLTTLLLIMALGYSAVSIDVNICGGGRRSPVDYGDLKQPGSGRLLKIRKGQFEVFGEKVFLSGADTFIEDQGDFFGDNNYRPHRQRDHECFLWEVSQSGGNSVQTQLHDTGSSTPLFNASGYVTALDRSGTFITDIRKYLRAAAHYNIVVFLSIWHKHILLKHPALIKKDAVLQSYIDNALLPLVKAIKDEPGFGGFDITRKAAFYIKRTKSQNLCLDTMHLHGLKTGLYSMENFLRFAGRHVEAIRSIDTSIPITLGASSDDLVQNQTYSVNHFADNCFELVSGLNTSLSFYIMDVIRSSTNPLAVDASYFNLDKPVILSRIMDVTSLKDNYNWAYSHGYSGAIASSALHDHFTHAGHMIGIESLKSEDNPSLGGLVNFTLTKYMICKLSGMSDCVDIN